MEEIREAFNLFDTDASGACTTPRSLQHLTLLLA